MIYITTTISVILVIYAIISKKSKCAFYLLLIWMWVLFAFNNSNADYEMYENFYNNYEASSIFQSLEICFQLLIKLGNTINLSYQQFIAFYSLIGLYIVKKAIMRMTENYSLVLGIYFIFPFFLDIVQIRHFMAFSIGTLAISYLVDNEKNRLIKYYLLALIAVGFHNSAMLFLLMPLSKKIKNEKLLTIMTVICIGMIVLIQTGLFIKVLGLIGIAGIKIELYFTSNTWRAGFIPILIYSVLQIVVLIVLMIFDKIYKTHQKHRELIEEEKEGKNNSIMQQMIFNNIVLLALIPMYNYTIEIIRIFRGNILFNHIAVSDILVKKNIKDNMTIIVIYLVVIFMLFMILINYTGIFEKTVYSILTKNYFLESII